jgi:2,4-dienoyl-CoA reductase-like NADH-dependent reductase (Old Yellow Enzyme family)
MPAADIDKLFTPVELGALSLRNRFVYAAMTRNRGFTPSALNVEYYRQRATECGLILSEGALIELQGSEWPQAPGLFTPDQVAGWKAVTDAVHKEGSLIVCQLWHLGRVLHPLHQGGKPNVGPSAVAARGGKFRLLAGEPGYQTPVAIADPEIYVTMFREAAVAAKAAGFDGVQLHSANGYLPNTFLDTLSNQRQDKWGGSVENRCRFSLRCIDELITVYGADRVGIKLSPVGGYNDMGMDKPTTLATYQYLIQQLSQRNIAFIELNRYTEAFVDKSRACVTLDVAKELRPFSTVPVVMNGGYGRDESAAEVESGVADAVSIGREYLANPDLPTRWKHGLASNQPSYATLYVYPEGEIEKGYTDYPFANATGLEKLTGDLELKSDK